MGRSEICWVVWLVMGLTLMSCGDDDGGTTPDSTVPDSTVPDSTVPDSAIPDSAALDAPAVEASMPDAAGPDATPAADASLPDAASPDGAAASPCSTDRDCAFGTHWCVGGACVECDDSGRLFDIACAWTGWSTYTRNGCMPCECAPPMGCTADTDCSRGEICDPGRFCTDWCPDGDPSCCWGNLCQAAGCDTPNPEGCRRQGCPVGQACERSGCTSGRCFCGGGGSWACNRDCGGGTCVGS